MDKIKSDKIVASLKNVYPDSQCALLYGGDPWRLLVMAILSAQCTDARVNIVSRGLFDRFPTAASMGEGDIADIEDSIRSCGLYRTKAANIKESSRIIASRFGGEVPSDMDKLLELPGVGRKIANLLRGDVFGLPAIVCDTHCIRLSGRLGYCSRDEKNPVKIEKILQEIIDPYEQSDFCHRLVFFGREYCTARSPRCARCPIAHLCESVGDNP